MCLCFHANGRCPPSKTSGKAQQMPQVLGASCLPRAKSAQRKGKERRPAPLLWSGEIGAAHSPITSTVAKLCTFLNCPLVAPAASAMCSRRFARVTRATRGPAESHRFASAAPPALPCEPPSRGAGMMTRSARTRRAQLPRTSLAAGTNLPPLRAPFPSVRLLAWSGAGRIIAAAS